MSWVCSALFFALLAFSGAVAVLRFGGGAGHVVTRAGSGIGPHCAPLEPPRVLQKGSTGGLQDWVSPLSAQAKKPQMFAVFQLAGIDTLSAVVDVITTHILDIEPSRIDDETYDRIQTHLVMALDAQEAAKPECLRASELTRKLKQKRDRAERADRRSETSTPSPKGDKRKKKSKPSPSVSSSSSSRSTPSSDPYATRAKTKSQKEKEATAKMVLAQMELYSKMSDGTQFSDEFRPGSKAVLEVTDHLQYKGGGLPNFHTVDWEADMVSIDAEDSFVKSSLARAPPRGAACCSPPALQPSGRPPPT